MAYTYLLELHETMKARIAEAQEKMTRAEEAGLSLEAQFHAGRLAELTRIDAFLVQNYLHLLPRRMQQVVLRGRTGPAV